MPDYDPQAYCSTANIVREPNGLFPSQRKAFYKEENRRRFGDDFVEEEKTKKNKSRDPRENRSMPYNLNAHNRQWS